MNLVRIVLLIIFVLSAFTGSVTGQPRIAIETLTEYIELLRSYNLETANYLWTESIQERSGRFGIEFQDIQIKVDCASPFMQYPEGLRLSIAGPAQLKDQSDDDDFITISYFTRKGVEETRHDYYLIRLGGDYWLTHPQDYYAHEWPIVHSKYFRVHSQPRVESFVNKHMLDQMDRFLEKTATNLSLSEEDIELIERDKIEYFFCESDTSVQLITGQLTRGLFDMATNDIISAAMPHFHEIVHLLVNIKLKKLPLFTIPLLREGIAVKYGGRWGKRPEALMDLAAYLYQERLMELDSILTYDDFTQTSGADINYPVAGILTSYLVDRLGREGFFELYLSLSGDIDQVRSWDCQDVKQIILAKTGHKDWLDLTLDFDRFLEDKLDHSRAALPGPITDGHEILKGEFFRVTENKEFYGFELAAFSSAPPTGNLLFGSESGQETTRSSLFAEQYQGQLTRDGYRFGLRYDQFEAGLYDYITNELVAKYIFSFSPSNDYFDSKTNMIFIRLRKPLIEDYLGEQVTCRLLPN